MLVYDLPHLAHVLRRVLRHTAFAFGGVAALAAAAAGLDNYKLVVVPEQKSMFQQMMSQFSGDNGEDVSIKTGIKEVDQLLNVLDDPQMLYARMPYVYEF